MRSAVIIAAFIIGLTCDDKKGTEQRKGRKEPICAVQDCATGKIIDDGCDETGRCASCINSCALSEPPSATPTPR